MRIKYFFPLIIFILLTYPPTLFMINDPGKIIQFSMFILSYSMAYFFGIKQTLYHRDAVVKIKQKSPILFPILFFSVPTIILTVIFIPRDFNIIIQFACCFIMALLSYAAGIYIVYRNIKKQVLKSCPSINTTGKTNRRLLLINPVNHNRIGLINNPSSSFPPLSLGLLASLTPDNFHIKLIDENMDHFEYEEADLVGITAFTSSANRAYEIASIYRKKGIPVVMGGIHVSMLPDEALSHVDSVVIGEAENTWPRVIEDFLNGKLKSKYLSEPSELINMPVPRRDIFSPKYLFATIQTSRGCPMNCNFCSVTAFNGSRYRQRPYEEVLDELSQIPQRYVFFIDDNIIGYSNESTQRALKLFKGMVEKKLNKVWFCQASINFGSDKEVLKWAKRAGCKMVFLGLESANPEELREMNKRINLKAEYDKVLKNINKHRIAVLGAFVNGTDTETEKALKQKADYILGHPIDVIQSTILTPLPGTSLFHRLKEESRLLYTDFPKDWERYDMSELTFKLKNMTGMEFMQKNRECLKRFYSKVNLIRQFFRTMIHTKSLEIAMWAYSSNKNYRNISLVHES